MEEISMMKYEMDCDMAKQALVENGYSVIEISSVNEGSNHFVFDVILTTNLRAICKFSKIRATEKEYMVINRDTLFGGELSLERESSIFELVQKKTKVPVPIVYGIHNSKFGKFILLQKMNGFSHKECMKRSGYSKSTFIKSLYYLGQDFAQIQKIQFPSFGNIMSRNKIEPAGITNFSERFWSVIKMRLDRCHAKKIFDNTSDEKMVHSFFESKIREYKKYLSYEVAPPVLVFTDMHAENFFTDANGRPTGYFDIESSQAAPSALEYYGFQFFLFNFYDQECFDLAKESFWKGYLSDGHSHIPLDCLNQKLVDFLAACRILELSQSYWGYVDGIRDSWGIQMRELLFKYIYTGVMDYLAVGDIWRSRDHNPKKPLKC